MHRSFVTAPSLPLQGVRRDEIECARILTSIRVDLLDVRCEVCRGGWPEFCGGMCVCGDSLFLLSLL